MTRPRNAAPAEVEGAASKKDMKDRMFIISVPDGEVLKDEGLDFKVLQFLTNEKFGDISAVGPRESIGKSAPQSVFRSSLAPPSRDHPPAQRPT